MEPASLIKVVGAFVAGVVVALGSALIYVRVSDVGRPVPVVQTAAAAPEAPPTQLPEAGNDSTDQTAVPAVEHVKRRKVIKPEPRFQERKQPVVEIAQNRPPVDPPVSSPEPAPPAPAVNEDPVQPAPQVIPAVQPVQQPQPHVVTLQPGMNLAIRLGETLSTDHNYTGDTFRGTLESPIIMDGFIIADKGSKVLGRIVNAEKAGRMEGVANLTLALTEINTTDGQRVRIETSTYGRKGQSSTGEEAAKIAGGAALGAIIGAVAGGGKGAAIGAGAGGAAGTGAVLIGHPKPAVLPIETRLSFRLATPVTITEKMNY